VLNFGFLGLKEILKGLNPEFAIGMASAAK